MKKKTTKKTAAKKTSTFLTGVGVAAAAAVGLVTFFTKTKRGKELSHSAERYMKDMVHALSKATSKMSTVTKKEYDILVDELVEQYQRNKKLTVSAGQELAGALKQQWSHVRRELSDSAKKSKQ